MNGRKYIPGLDGYDNGEHPTLSVWDEWDREEAESEEWPEGDETQDENHPSGVQPS